MKFLFKTQFSFSDNGILDKLLVLLLKALSVLFCALFPPLLFSFVHKGFFFFRYFKTPVNKEPLLEEDSNEILHERIDLEEDETPFSDLSFRFPTYEEFIRTGETVDSAIVDASNENDFLVEEGSILSNSDVDVKVHPGEDPEVFHQNGLNCTDGFRNEELDVEDEESKNDDRNDSVEAISGSFDRKTEDSDELEWEEELQMEIMKAKAHGLPSIPEESEYPVAVEEDLRPWKTEENLDDRDITKELQKLHKIYREKMRKYDTLNHQKTYAKGQLYKYQLHSFISFSCVSLNESSFPHGKLSELKLMQSKDSQESVLSKSFWVCRPKKADAKAEKSRKFDGDLEVVYVVQLWVSWEFLVWQYKKTLELCGRGAHGSCRYNEVAGKFEHFGVLIQRFMENEWFEEGSRVECYARNRLARTKLLQVPLVKEDEVKDNKKERGKDGDNENSIKIDRLVEILQESIRILWQFIGTDKLTNILILKSQLGAKQECESPAHSKILEQILLDLKKKGRKLKKNMKRQNCMLKNFEEPSEDDPDDELYFFSLVDLKLVSRVLNMQRITREQLSWCHHKLSCISFPNGKIEVEPSSFFFPS